MEQSGPNLRLAWTQEGTQETFYDMWRSEMEGVPHVDGLYLDDVHTVDLHPWPRKGGRGVYLNLSNQQLSDAQIVEIPPGGRLNPEKHLFEEMVFVLSGRGATDVWNEGEQRLTFEWQAGSMFAIPLNSWHEFYNGSGSEPARYLAFTDAPLVMNRFRNTDFVFNNDYTFIDRYTYSQDYFSGEGEDLGRILKTNFVADVLGTKLVASPDAPGVGYGRFVLAGGTMTAHTARVPAGRYRFGHRHGAGAYILWLKGTGHDRTWETETTNVAQIPWHAGTITSPPEWWYHQHFNTGSEPAVALAFHVNSLVAEVAGELRRFQNPALREVPFDLEDPQIREDYKRELEKLGIPFDMEEVYQNDREIRRQPAAVGD